MATSTVQAATAILARGGAVGLSTAPQLLPAASASASASASVRRPLRPHHSSGSTARLVSPAVRLPGLCGASQRRRRRCGVVAAADVAVEEGAARRQKKAISIRSLREDLGEELLRTLGLAGEESEASCSGRPALVPGPLPAPKTIVLVRHGQSSWNKESRIQGNTDESVLTEEGIEQARRCRRALEPLPFEVCYASPISRAKTSAEVIWQDREEPLVYLDGLREANLRFLQGMYNADAAILHAEDFRFWRTEPENFCVDGTYPVRELWEHARAAWRDILLGEGSLVLVVSHKSILRALLGVAIGLSPSNFRAVDVANGGLCILTVSTAGLASVRAVNLSDHMTDTDVSYCL
eukprot:jgi/Chlat1/7395/Chrsp6S07424